MVQVALSSTPASGQPRPGHTPKTSRFVFVLAFSAVIGGFLFGYDTGVVSAAMLYVPDNGGMKPMSSVWQELIVSFTPGFAAVGSLLSGPGSDAWGRRMVIIISSIVFSIGALICGAAPDKPVLLAARVFLGLAIGFSSTIVPVYVGEAAPSHIRGQLVTGFQLMITIGLLAANLIAGGFSYIDPDNVGWRLMFGFAVVPSAIQLLLFLTLPESPRWLFEHGREAEAREVVERIYAGDQAWTEFELGEIRFTCEQELEAKRTNEGGGLVIARVFRTPHVRKALAIGCLTQFFQQFSGVNTIFYYCGEIVRSAGIKSNHSSIWISGGLSLVNVIFTFVPMYLIERVGRRKLMMVSVAGVLLSLLAMSTAFLLIHVDSSKTITNHTLYANDPYDKDAKHAAKCLKFTNCDYCVTNDNCGFCEHTSEKKGYCLPFGDDHKDTQSATGICSGNGQPGWEWEDTYCKTKWTILPIILMVIYLAFFASGYAPLAWVINSEFYPLWARSTCVAMATATNWTANLLVSLTFLSLQQALTKYGTYLFYSGFTIVALVFFFFMLPETQGYTIEEVEKLFMTPDARRRAEDAEAANAKRNQQARSQENEDAASALGVEKF